MFDKGQEYLKENKIKGDDGGDEGLQQQKYLQKQGLTM